tara:strand:- start:1355 stop:2779 length:1425 start_codon:yes stop_codon:yes gene_type:complete
MSKIEVNKVGPQCGTTVTVGCGAGQTVVVDANTVTLGRCGGTVSLASGATQSGFGRTGTVDWQTGSIKTATFTATNGEGYFCNTSGGAFTVNLPAGSAGAIVSVVDYTNTFQTYSLTVSPNGSEKIGGVAADAVLNTEGQSVTFVYVDATEGWKNIQDSTSNVAGNEYIVATGGTITTCGNDKIHKFTGPGTFAVTAVHPCATYNLVSYMVTAGGGGGSGGPSGDGGGAGGAGGFRELVSPTAPYSASPLNGYPTPGNRITVSATPYPITVGGGGSGTSAYQTAGGNGNPSVFSSITSTAGGGGGGNTTSALAGGSGGGGGGGGSPPGANTFPGGAGNTPPVTPSQGNTGGTGGAVGPGTDQRGGGGGGATAVGANSQPPNMGGNGGAGATTSITGSPVAYAGGGGGMSSPTQSGNSSGGTGGGGGGSGCGVAAVAGGCNTGGGGGGAGGSIAPAPVTGANGGSGVVIIRYRYQ